MSDIVRYLNSDQSSPFFSKLLRLIAESKQAKAPVSQWLSTIDAFTQKGVKQIEMTESGLIDHLKTLGDKTVLTKEEILLEAQRRYYTIKEVVLGTPKFPGYRQPGGNYMEFLYIANSERANIEDALEEVDFEMEDLRFYPERIAEDPGIVTKLEKRRESLMRSQVDAVEFSQHHFSDRIEGKHGKNLLAHCRVSIHGDTYFIDEIQSDWAQRGRRANWIGIPRGPLVTNSEAWAGMVLRRQMQIAAGMPGIKRFAWITESMRNGGRQNRALELENNEKRKAFQAYVAKNLEERLAQIGADRMTPEELAKAKELARPAIVSEAHKLGLQEPHDMLNDFYLVMVPKLADKALGKSGGKAVMTKFKLDSYVATGTYGSAVVNQDNMVEVPAIEITPAVREHLACAQPVYSRAPVVHGPLDMTEVEKNVAEALKSAKEMLGSVRHLRFANHVYDVATGHKVAGRYLNKLVQISLHAGDIVEATEHECFHFATDNLMHLHEVAMLEEDFAPGTELNFRVRDALIKRGMIEAAGQCNEPLEAAAHAFTLWKRGHVSITERPVQGLFSDLVNLVKDTVRWLRRVVLEERATSAEELFEALSSGALAADASRMGAARAPARPDEQDVLAEVMSIRQGVVG